MTMNVIAKQSYVFLNSGKNENGTSDASASTDRVVVRSQSDMQAVPDWVRKTSLFGHAVKAGGIYEVAVASPERPKAKSDDGGETRLTGSKKKSDQ